MRGKRSKQYRKLMHAYALTFGFRAPYQVLLSSTIIRDAARFKMQLGHMLSNTLHGEIKPMITQCCIRHLYKAVPEPGQERDKEAWIDVAKQAERRRCGHHELEEPLSEL
jgi:U3 small nucleolar RNA-associated protein 23